MEEIKARIKELTDILNKANYNGENPDIYKFKEELEYSLINSLYDFPQVIETSLNSSESVPITNYLYSVSQKFSKLYENIPILTEDDELIRQSRLVLLNATKTVLSNGMNVLGIEPVKKF